MNFAIVLPNVDQFFVGSVAEISERSANVIGRYCRRRDENNSDEGDEARRQDH